MTLGLFKGNDKLRAELKIEVLKDFKRGEK